MKPLPGDLRQHFTIKGDPKRPYGEATARAEAARHGKNAYQCPICKHWHIGGRA